MGLFSKIKKAFSKVYKYTKKSVASLLGTAMVKQAKKATEQAERAAAEAKAQYEAETLKAEETAAAIKNEEAERKKRLAALGTQKPSTLISGYLGSQTSAITKKRTLG